MDLKANLWPTVGKILLGLSMFGAAYSFRVEEKHKQAELEDQAAHKVELLREEYNRDLAEGRNLTGEFILNSVAHDTLPDKTASVIAAEGSFVNQGGDTTALTVLDMGRAYDLSTRFNKHLLYFPFTEGEASAEAHKNLDFKAYRSSYIFGTTRTLAEMRAAFANADENVTSRIPAGDHSSLHLLDGAELQTINDAGVKTDPGKHYAIPVQRRSVDAGKEVTLAVKSQAP